MATRGYHRYRGRGGGGGRGGQALRIAALVLILLAAVAFLLAQRYVEIDENGKPRFTLFDGKKKMPENPIDPRDVVIDRGDADDTDEPARPDEPHEPKDPTPARRKLEALHASQPEYGCLWWTPELVLSRSDEAMVIEVKRQGGGITYGTQIQTPSGVFVERGVTRGNLSTLLQGGKYTVASICCFVDPALGQSHPTLALTTEAGGLWYDAGGRVWLDPADDTVRTYLTALCRECAELGFREILLDEFCYPAAGNLSTIDSRKLENRTATLAELAQALRKALPEEVALSIALRSDMGEPGGESGLTAELLGSFDRIYMDGGVNAEALRKGLPEDFDAESGLVLLTRTKPTSGSYVLLP